MTNFDGNLNTGTDTNPTNVLNLDIATGTQDNTTKNAFDPPKSEDYRGELWRERTRTYLALALLLSIGFTQFSVFCYLFTPVALQFLGNKKDNKDLKDNVVKLNDSAFVYVVKEEKEEGKDGKELITLLWTSQVTLIGSALGFYFAANKEVSKDE